MDGAEDPRRAGDVGRVHAADLGVTSQQDGRHAEFGPYALGDVMQVESAGHAKEELEHAHAANARGEKMSALVDEDESGKKHEAPEQGADESDD